MKKMKWMLSLIMLFALAFTACENGGTVFARFFLQFSLPCDKINKKEAVVMIEQVLMMSNCLFRKDYVHDNCKQ